VNGKARCGQQTNGPMQNADPCSGRVADEVVQTVAAQRQQAHGEHEKQPGTAMQMPAPIVRHMDSQERAECQQKADDGCAVHPQPPDLGRMRYIAKRPWSAEPAPDSSNSAPLKYNQR
jgi:hypothetical protein